MQQSVKNNFAGWYGDFAGKDFSSPFEGMQKTSRKFTLKKAEASNGRAKLTETAEIMSKK
jgi:hypothetical protein